MLEPIFKELCAEKGIEIAEVEPLIKLVYKFLNRPIRIAYTRSYTAEQLNTEENRGFLKKLLNRYLENGYDRNTRFTYLMEVEDILRK